MNTLSESDRQKLGTTISEKTLYRVLRKSYDFAEPMDKRRRRTLDVLTRFLDFQDWSHFKRAKREAQTLDNQVDQNGLDLLVENALEQEFLAYKSLHISSGSLEKYFIPDHPAILQIQGVIERSREKNLTISEDGNPSYYRLLDSEVVKLRKIEAHIRTKELWYLRWVHADTRELAARYHKLNDQFYTLRKINGRWMIDCNYYPTD